MLPFTRAEFISVFAAYNAGVWPVQVLAHLLGLSIVVVLVRPSPASGRVVGAGLAAMWVWTGIVYHGIHFSAINRAAFAFAALFVLQGALLPHAALIRRGSAAFLLGIPQDWVLFVSAAAALALVVRSPARRVAGLSAL